jgi:hypothetical protein
MAFATGWGFQFIDDALLRIPNDVAHGFDLRELVRPVLYNILESINVRVPVSTY